MMKFRYPAKINQMVYGVIIDVTKKYSFFALIIMSKFIEIMESIKKKANPIKFHSKKIGVHIQLSSNWIEYIFIKGLIAGS